MMMGRRVSSGVGECVRLCSAVVVCGRGAGAVRVRCGCGAGAVRVWCGCGAGVVRARCGCGAGVVRVGCKRAGECG